MFHLCKFGKTESTEQSKDQKWDNVLSVDNIWVTFVVYLVDLEILKSLSIFFSIC